MPQIGITQDLTDEKRKLNSLAIAFKTQICYSLPERAVDHYEALQAYAVRPFGGNAAVLFRTEQAFLERMKQCQTALIEIKTFVDQHDSLTSRRPVLNSHLQRYQDELDMTLETFIWDDERLLERWGQLRALGGDIALNIEVGYHRSY